MIETGRVFFGRNLHTVLPGRVYRSAQLSEAALRQVIGAYGIRTVLNLRGCCDPKPFYLDECRATHDAGVGQEDISLSAGRLPPVHEMRRLLEVLDRVEYPILIHCRRGSDRTGLVSASVMLLETDVSLPEAKRELGLRYGHVRLGRTTYLDEFFDLYSEWLTDTEQTHSPDTFRAWLAHGYSPAECTSRLEVVAMPKRLGRNQPVGLHLRATNRGTRTWRFSPNTNAGVHAGYLLWGPDDEFVSQGWAGLFDREIGVGESIDLILGLPGLSRPGVYRLFVDMKDEQHCWFYQAGSEPLDLEFHVE